VASPTSLLSVSLHHRAKRIDAGCQAEPIEAHGHLVLRFAHSPGIRRSQNDRCCANSLRGVVFLSWNRHPELTGAKRGAEFPCLAGQLIVNGKQMTLFAHSIIDTRRDQMFPVLDPKEIERARRFGEVRTYEQVALSAV
jgi:hypothetical protein